MAGAARWGQVALPGAAPPARRVWDWPPAAPTERPLPAHPRLVSGFIVPVGGMEVPPEEQYLPNSPRDARAGYHQGIDFPARARPPVLAAKGGTVFPPPTAFTAVR